MDKKNLISLAETISKECYFSVKRFAPDKDLGKYDSTKYFEFASNYLMNSRKSNIQSISDFFKMLENCKSNTNRPTVRHVFGVRGGNNKIIEAWINNILYNQNLKKLSFNELHYVMAIATRYAKIYNLDPPKR